jgi:C-methyltransferase C-terminal domain/Putative zinc binding domain/Methyltransferase domain
MACMVCGADAVVQHLDLGEHPVATFFLTNQTAPEVTHPIRLGQCEACGTIQLMQPVPHTALVAPYDWIVSREPEEHLDQAVAKLMALPGITTASVIAGLSYKDDTTLDRFRPFGFDAIWRVDLRDDLGATHPNANIETVQKLTTPASMHAVAARRGQADILVVRHIIEHAEDLQAFIQGCAALVKPGGYIMVECPDCSRNLDLADAAMAWEEHSIYFTPATFENVLSTAGFETVFLDNYPLPFENCLVMVARKTGEPGPLFVSEAAKAERGWLMHYAARHAPITAALRARLEHVRAEEGPIAIFGAGHLACAFVLFHGLADLIDCVVDDTAQKQGLFLPGARLPILPSRALVERGVKLCLFAVSPNSEDKIAGFNAAFTDAGGRFASILAASKRSIRHEIVVPSP